MNTIKLNLRKGFNYSFYTLTSLVLLLLGSLVYLKIEFPQNTGLFFLDGKFRAFGLLRTIENSNEVLGIWFIPFVLFIAVAIIIAILKNIKK